MSAPQGRVPTSSRREDRDTSPFALMMLTDARSGRWFATTCSTAGISSVFPCSIVLVTPFATMPANSSAFSCCPRSMSAE
jgi:hypothetical protein